MKKGIVFVSTYKSHAVELSEKITVFLTERDVSVSVFNCDTLSADVPELSGVNFAISLGGDGTVLFTARHCALYGVPVFPINLGEFGFIAAIHPENWQEPLIRFLNAEEPLYERMLLSASVCRNGKPIAVFNALNDIVVSGSGIAKLVDVDISFNGIPFGIYRADGVIISTPTGSTAYSAASGGPILDPNVSAFVLTPISAFSLSNRPIVLPSSGELSVTILPMRHKTTIVSVDGQEMFSLQDYDELKIGASCYKVQLAGCTPAAFYDALRSKLEWKGSAITHTTLSQ